jgi:hypothetical protein
LVFVCVLCFTFMFVLLLFLICFFQIILFCNALWTWVLCFQFGNL